MQAIKLSKKYPEFKQDEIFDLINQFKYVPRCLSTFVVILPFQSFFFRVDRPHLVQCKCPITCYIGGEGVTKILLSAEVR